MMIAADVAAAATVATAVAGLAIPKAIRKQPIVAGKAVAIPTGVTMADPATMMTIADAPAVHAMKTTIVMVVVTAAADGTPPGAIPKAGVTVKF